MTYVLFRKLSGRKVEYKLWEIADHYNRDHFEVVRMVCRIHKLEGTPGFVSEEKRPVRRYYFCDGWDICIRKATPGDHEAWSRKVQLEEEQLKKSFAEEV